MNLNHNDVPLSSSSTSSLSNKNLSNVKKPISSTSASRLTKQLHRHHHHNNHHHHYFNHFNYFNYLLVYVLICLVQLGASQIQLNNNNDTTNTNITSSSSQNNGSSANKMDNLYTCPSNCKCEYETIWKKLKIVGQNDIESRKKPYNNNNNNNNDSVKTTTTTIDLSEGVRHLIIDNVNFNTVSYLFPILEENQLVNLEIQDSSFDPMLVFNSQLIELAEMSLKKIVLSRIQVVSSTTTTSSSDSLLSSSSFAGSILPQLSTSTSADKGVLQALARLKTLDTLIVKDCSSKLSNLIVQSLPVASHISIVNSELSELFPENFAHLFSLKSLNLSHNKIESIPARLTKNLPKLETFDISYNFIKHLQEEVFIGLISLEKLDISQNMIQYVDNDVFNPLGEIQSIDMSHNNVIQIFEPYFEKNRNLSTLNMKNTWTNNTFIDSETRARSHMEMEKLINTLQSVKNLDLSDNKMTTIPETLTHIPLNRVDLDGNPWQCSCQDRWILPWRETTNVDIVNSNNSSDSSSLFCYSGSEKIPIRAYLNSLNCTSPVIASPMKYYSHMGINAVLQCHRAFLSTSKWPDILWITPDKEKIQYINHHHHDHQQNDNDENNNNKISLNNNNTVNNSNNNNNNKNNHHQHAHHKHYRVLENGNLDITNVTRSDFGRYVCIAQYEKLNVTHFIHLGVDTSIFLRVRILSFCIGWAGSFGFLLLVLTYHFIKSLLRRCGVECVSVQSSYKSRRIKAFFENMEQNKTIQLDWLRDNYNMQATKIKDNCFTQLERIRDSYTLQTKNIQDIRDYGAHHLHQMRDQYHDQVQKVSGYSAHQLCKVRENYIFQRNRVCKFSSHQLLRLRESYKWQAQTLNKILENLPRTLNFDTCRLGTCTSDSMYLEDIGEFQSGADDSTLQYPSREVDIFSCPEKVRLLIPPELMLSHIENLRRKEIMSKELMSREDGPSRPLVSSITDSSIVNSCNDIDDDDDDEDDSGGVVLEQNKTPQQSDTTEYSQVNDEKSQNTTPDSLQVNIC